MPRDEEGPPEIFATGMAIDNSMCSMCSHVGIVIVFHDRTKGQIKLCDNCMGQHHVHVNMEPCTRPVKVKPPEDVAQARLDRVEKEEVIRERMERTGRRHFPVMTPETMDKDAAQIIEACKQNPLFSAGMGLLMLRKCNEIAYEKTADDGTNVVTERLECRNEV